MNKTRKAIIILEAITIVKLLVGHKGSGKTKQMIELANESVETSKGSIIFINKNHRLMYDLKYRIRVICMEDFEHVIATNTSVFYTGSSVPTMILKQSLSTAF